MIPVRFKKFKFDTATNKLYATGYDLDGTFSITGTFDLFYNKFILSKSYSNIELVKTELIGTILEKSYNLTGMYIKPRDNGMFKFFNIDVSR